MARILVVDDDRAARIGLAGILELAGYEADTASDGEEALEKVAATDYDLIISDVMMPKTDGFGLVTQMRQRSRTSDFPIILVSAVAESNRRAHGLDLGADDFMAKPVDVEELLARIRTQLRHASRNRELLRNSTRDELTGVLNRRGIMDALESMLESSSQTREVGSVLMVDLNKFKALNDTHGHAAGDALLRAVAESLEGGIRLHDQIGRVGGDEFLIVLPNTGSDSALALAERLREGVRVVGASIAIGAATTEGTELAEVVVKRADAEMYFDKRRQSPRRAS